MLKKKPKYLDSQFLIRVIKNEVSPEEHEFFLSWLSESDKNKEEFGDLVHLWDLADNSQISEIPNPTEQWDNIQAALNKTPISIKHKPQQIETSVNSPQINYKYSSPIKTDFSWLYQVAAMIIIMIGVFFLIKQNNPVLPNQPRQAAEQQLIINHELTTQKGERKTLPLSDGTIVYLNSDSKLVYPAIFAESSREVEVEGEAYFSVIPDKSRAFKVKSGNVVTIVTGTEFNVKNRNGRVNVVVAKGSVTTYSNGFVEGINLKKGEMITFSEKRGFSSPTKVNLDYFLAWRWDKLAFARTSLNDVMAEVERCYNLPVVFQNDSIRTKRFTGTFKTDSLSQLLSIISLTLDVKINYDGHKVILN
ncbi:MAG: FecR domain-containing protein [Ignavibacteriaceae bacterium]|nr:FecR domain-containing protein [Ignavibacteriaceae bacterium]